MTLLNLLKRCYNVLNNHTKFGLEIITRILLMLVSLIITYCLSKILANINNQDATIIIHFTYMLLMVYMISLLLRFLNFTLRQDIEKTTRVNLKQKILQDMIKSFHVNFRKKGNFNSAKATEIMYTDVNNITSLLFLSVDFMINFIIIFVVGIILFVINMYLALVLTIILLIAAIFVYKYSKMLKQINEKLRNITDIHFTLTRDILKNLKYICLSNSGAFHTVRFKNNLNKVKDETLYRDKKAWLLGFFSTILNYLWIIIFLLGTILQLKQGNINITEFMLFFSYSRLYSTSITNLLTQYSNLQQLTVSVARAFQLLDQSKGESKNEKDKVWFPDKLISITIEDLSFSYEEQAIFRNLNYRITQSPVIISGKNGRGKTTLMNIIGGVLIPQCGTVKFNEIPIKNIQFQNLCDSISYAAQGDILFDMSIRDNLLSFGKSENIKEEEIYDICRKVGIFEDIIKLNKKFDTLISEIREFSFGQKKKMLLARACLRPSQIILFDEPLEGLDIQSQQLVVELIKELSTKKFVIVSTHKKEMFDFGKMHIAL